MEIELPSSRDENENASVLEAGHGSAMQWEVLAYFALLNIAVGLGSPLGIAAIPITYFLKDGLHLTPVQLAVFLAIGSIPVCGGFVFGFIRDRWRSARWGDRQYLLVCALAAAGMYLWLATSTTDYYKLLALVFIVVAVYVMIFAAAQALMTGVAQAHGMTGRLSVVFSFGYFTPAVLSALAGGWLVAHASVRGTFLIAAGVTIVIATQSFWRLGASSEFERLLARGETGFAAMRRLIRHRPLWPAAAIYFLWNFSPGWGTPMFYHLTERVRISSELFGTFTALQSLFFLPTTLLYGVLCVRAPLSRLLWWGTIVAILQGPIMFLAQGPASTIAVAVLYGLFGGFATAAYIDLIMRSCPKGLEGTAMMVANTSAFALAGNAGNLLGSWIYSRGGFAWAVIITTLATALIVSALRSIPPELIATHDGERIEPGAGLRA
ncbi:MAG TPA: MFS transporter [Candidatus Binatus sp.]|uniref:MFS transporter n=1 Tax=Candidatus Binatus sp. TaxID=2811406 RepID=UPI002B4892F0|nr:MFS transporter [Candidatus Binatus sp.]HKN13273.1 MFS transporter [Candidatus Binatus sp.]